MSSDATLRLQELRRPPEGEAGVTVSVIIIFLNPGGFLDEAIRSVFAQTLVDWELILVDDGSSDGSSELARGYAVRHPERVRYLEHPGHVNRGMSASRNLGFGASRGRYVCFLDADDVWRTDKLAGQVALLAATPEVAVVGGAALFWFSWTGDPADADRDFVAPLAAPAGTIVRPPTLMVEVLQRRAPNIGFSNAMLRREAFAAVGGCEEIFRGMYEDHVFFAKLLLDHSALFANETWIKYRKHPGSCLVSCRRAGGENAARRFYLRWLGGYLARRRDVDPRVLRAYEEEWRPHRLRTRVWRRLRRLARRAVAGEAATARGR
jgi:glycosyltransferase involved in cell wall biosynthesis